MLFYEFINVEFLLILIVIKILKICDVVFDFIEEQLLFETYCIAL